MIETTEQQCDIDDCPNAASYMRKDCLGTVHHACTDHSELLEVWCQEAFEERDKAAATAGGSVRPE